MSLPQLLQKCHTLVFKQRFPQGEELSLLGRKCAGVSRSPRRFADVRKIVGAQPELLCKGLSRLLSKRLLGIQELRNSTL